jgi:tripartite-type tricarboxylate transporter receptor subunit TctC
MQWILRRRLPAPFAAAILLTLIGLTLTGTAAWPQSGHTIRLILPFPPGGPADAMARVLADQIGKSGGPAFVIESHPGASTEIGTELVSRAAPDGDTLAIISNSFITLPHLRKLKYDPLTDFAAVCELASFPPLIAVNSQSPYKTLADFIAAARAQPGTLTLASIGPGSSSQIAFEMLKRAANVNITFIPFPGYTPSIQAVLGNQVTAAIADLSTLQGQLKGGQLRALATFVPKRIDLLPEMPTVIESGYNVEAAFFGAIVTPAKTPKDTIGKLIAMFRAAMQAPGVKTRFAELGFYPGGSCGADFSAQLHKQYEEYGAIIRDANMKMD